MRRRRIVFYIAWILSLVGISFFGGVVSYGIFYAMTLLPFILFGYLLFCKATFKIYQKLDGKYVVCRTPVTYYFTLQNETFLAFSRLKVTFYEFGADYGDLNKDEEYELMPQSGYKLTTNIACKFRGEYNIGVENVTITDFLGLFSITYKNKEPLKVNILPAIEYPDESFSEIKEIIAGQVDKSAPEKRDLLVRAYVQGDPIRSINWKATARSQKLMTSEMISEDLGNITLVLDTCRRFKKPEEYLPCEDELFTKLITLILYYINNHIGVSIYYYSGGYKHITLSSMNQFDEAYNAICAIKFSEDSDIVTVLENIKREVSPAGGSIFVLGTHKDGAFFISEHGSVDDREVTK